MGKRKHPLAGSNARPVPCYSVTYFPSTFTLSVCSLSNCLSPPLFSPLQASLPSFSLPLDGFFFLKKQKYNTMISWFIDCLYMVTLGIFLSDSDPSTSSIRRGLSEREQSQLMPQALVTGFPTSAHHTSTSSIRAGSFNQKIHNYNTTFLRRIQNWYIFCKMITYKVVLRRTHLSQGYRCQTYLGIKLMDLIRNILRQTDYISF